MTTHRSAWRRDKVSKSNSLSLFSQLNVFLTVYLVVGPDPPVLELKEVKQNTISLFWIPGFEGDSPITGYYLEYKAVNGKRCTWNNNSVSLRGLVRVRCMCFPTASWDSTTTVVDFSSNQTNVTIIEVNPSTYNIRMFAKNSLGTSKASNVLTITTEEAGIVFPHITFSSYTLRVLSVVLRSQWQVASCAVHYISTGL